VQVELHPHLVKVTQAVQGFHQLQELLAAQAVAVVRLL
jgi:hypothetical protein